MFDADGATSQPHPALAPVLPLPPVPLPPPPAPLPEPLLLLTLTGPPPVLLVVVAPPAPAPPAPELPAPEPPAPLVVAPEPPAPPLLEVVPLELELPEPLVIWSMQSPEPSQTPPFWQGVPGSDGKPVTQVPVPSQKLPCEQASLQSVPNIRGVMKQAPVEAVHPAATQGLVLAGHVFAVPVQVPAWHVSPLVQSEPSSHAVPSGFGV